MSRLASAIALTVALGGAGCSWVAASPYEHAAYRRTRVAPSFEQRLTAAREYLERYPDGAYAPQVKRYVERAEPVFFEARQRDEQGLQAYLRALPKGAHAAEARSRLALLERERSRPDALSAAASATEARLAAARAQREKARGEVAFWIESLCDPAVYAAPLTEGPAELLVAYSLALPAPRCERHDGGRTCDKAITLEYSLPSKGGLVPRSLGFSVTLQQDDAGRPRAAKLEGPELFSRLEEAFALQEIDFASSEHRVAALERALELVTVAFQARVSEDPACSKPVTAPDLVRLSCAGVTVVASAAPEPGGPDSVTFELTP